MIRLWPHQLRAAERALQRHTLLAHEPGCGKTFAAAEVIRRAGGPALYVCPATLRWQVAAELARYQPGWRVQVLLNGTTRMRAAADIIVVTYDLLTRPSVWRDAFARDWAVLVLDEAHYLKNREAKRTRAIYGSRTTSKGALFRKARVVVPMTGTPVLNSPADLWTHYSRLFPDALVSDEGKPLTFAQWVERFCVVRNTGFGEQIVGGKNLSELAALLAPHLDRVRREDVLRDLPALTVDQIAIDGSAALTVPEDCPREALEELRRLVAQEAGDFDAEALDGLAPALATLRHQIGWLKIHSAAALIADELAGGESKIVVYGLHPAVLDALADECEARGFNPVKIHGDVPMSRRDAAVSAFVSATNCRVFIGQLYAAGAGLNLQAASRVLILEPAWTPAINEQAIARCHRAGQLNPVRASFLSLRGTIDDRVVSALARKARVVSRIIDNPEGQQ